LSMTIKLSRDEAFDLAFRRDGWLLLKVPVLLVLGWLFFLPQMWKILVLLVSSLVAYFRLPGPAGPNVTSFHMTVMLIAMLVIWFAVLWYTIYVMAYLSRPGFSNRLIGVAGIIMLPVGLIAVALAAGVIGSVFGVPQDELFAYLDRWAPFDSWRVSR